LAAENLLIERVRSTELPSARSGENVSIGIGDDAAVWRPRPGYETLLTCDWFLEGSHFLPERHPADSVGWKCLARAASDIAAMGAMPRCFLLSLALPKSRTGVWLDRFLQGLRAASRRWNCPIAGGDTTRREEVLINVTVVGDCPRGLALLRQGARVGEAIFVSGHLGEAEYGLQLVRRTRGRLNPYDRRLRKHLYPEPRLALGSWLASRQLATAMMDLSDGLSTDLARLCAASRVGARIDAQCIPTVAVSNASEMKIDPLALALHGGDDYELLFTVAPEKVRRIPRRIAGVAVKRIGQVISGKEIVLIGKDGKPARLQEKGWDPFR
jgi:thiamine-monophosphate kinase